MGVKDRAEDPNAILIDHLPFVAWHKDAQGRFLAVNRAFSDACGRSTPEELIGLTDYDVWPKELATRYRADDDTVLSTGEARLVEEPIAGPDEVRFFETYKTAVRDRSGRTVGTVGFARDITVRHNAEVALREQEDTLRLFTELASDYVYTVDLQVQPLAPTMVAGSFEQTTGFSLEQLATRGGWLSIVHPDDRERVEGVSKAIQAAEPVVIEYRIVHPDGSVRWLRDRIRPIATGGRITRLVGGVRDITENRRQEEELRRRNEQLAQAAKLEAVGRLANGVAHDFNNLLTAILGFSEVIAMQLESNAPVLADLREVQAAAKRGASLTRQLLAFSRSSAEMPSLVDVNELLSNLEKMLGRLLGSEVDFSLTTSESPAVVRISPHELERVVVNLALNGRDAMPRGGMLSVSVGHVDLDEAAAGEAGVRPGAFVAIRVTDTGVGLEPEVRERLFEPFFTTKESGAGTGLGLATSYGIVRQVHGAMVVRSKPGEGSTFEVLLPSIDEPLSAPPPSPPALRGNRRGNILLVDDEPQIRDLAGRYLRQLGYQVRTAAHAGEALVFAEDPSVQIQLLVTDLVMPDMDGLELARRLSLRRPDLRVIFMTGYFPPEALRAAQEDGHPVLRKPFSLPDLGHTVAKLVDEET
jgi:PAS domain S-box-containing protein